MDIINFPAPWRLGDGALAAGGHQVRSSLSGGGMPGRWEVGKERRPLSPSPFRHPLSRVWLPNEFWGFGFQRFLDYKIVTTNVVPPLL